jgi:hypothetical protein
MSSFLSKFGVDVTNDLKETLLLTLEMAGSDEVVNKVTDIYAAYFKALQNRGFTRDEAMQLLSKMPVGNMQK